MSRPRRWWLFHGAAWRPDRNPPGSVTERWSAGRRFAQVTSGRLVQIYQAEFPYYYYSHAVPVKATASISPSRQRVSELYPVSHQRSVKCNMTKRLGQHGKRGRQQRESSGATPGDAPSAAERVDLSVSRGRR